MALLHLLCLAAAYRFSRVGLVMIVTVRNMLSHESYYRVKIDTGTTTITSSVAGTCSILFCRCFYISLSSYLKVLKIDVIHHN